MFTLTMAAQTVAKKTPLLDQELKRWSHLDLEKDSIPGMSVDKAYSEFLKNSLDYHIRCIYFLNY